MNRPPFTIALGISTGDIVRTSYGTGPYEVWEIVRSAGETVSLVLVAVGCPNPGRTSSHFFINNIRREGDRWFNPRGDEIFVEPSHRPQQAGLFGDAL